jgi:outer membrane protein
MKRFSSFLSALSLSIGLVAPVSALAQDYKIGFVNLDRIMRDSTPAKAAQTRLENEFSKREKEIDELAQQVKNASDKLVKDSAGSGLSESDKARRQRDLLDQDRELQRKRREFQEDFSQRKNEEVSNLLERANRVVKQIFEQERYDLILQDPVFASPRLDITDKVIKALNNGSK